LAFFHPGIGAPLAVGMLEEMIARGCQKFIAVGGCGVLDKEIAVGQLLLMLEQVEGGKPETENRPLCGWRDRSL
jgi:uridine phosphorylase